MEMKIYYVIALLVVSFLIFATAAPLFGGTDEGYRDFLLTVAVVHFVMAKLISVKKKERAMEE